MLISSRFAEYAVTGAFFWIGQFIIFITWSHLTGVPPSLPPGISSFLQQLPDALQPSTNNLVGAFGIMGIFVVGLLLDLFGGYFIIMEMNIFRKHLKKNDEWLKEVVEKNGSYAASDYIEFSSKFGTLKLQWQEALDICMLWNHKRRKRIIDHFKRAVTRFRLIRPYSRLWSFFSSFVAVFSGSSQIGIFIDQTYLWRTSRAISTTMIIFVLEITVIPLLLLQRATTSPGLFEAICLVWGIQITLMLASVLITLVAYSRMCVTLFSLAYVTNEKLRLDHASKSL